MRKRSELSDRELAQRSERWAFWAVIVAIVAIVAGVLSTLWAVRRSEQLTAETGALDKARPHLYFASDRVEMPLRICVAAPFTDKSLTIVQLPLVVRNDGDKTTKGVELLVREPAAIAVNNDSIKATVESSVPISAAPERHIMTSGKYAYVSFALPDMHPGQTAEVNEPIVVTDSTVHREFKVMSKDGVPVSVGFSMVYGLPITVSIAGEDLHTADYDLELMGIKANTKEELVAAFKEEVHKEKESYRKTAGFWRYTLDSFSPSPRHAVLITSDLEEVHADGGVTVYIARKILDAKDATYNMP
jgi:hypothetical protein